MTNHIDLAIVGAASLAGESVLSLLAERQFPLGNLYAVDNVEQAGSHVEFRDEPLAIHELADFDFEQVQLAIFLCDASVAVEYVPKASDAGCVVIDSSVCFRYEHDVPLLIPGVNDTALADYRERMLVAIPANATSQLLKTLKPIHDAVGIEQIHVTVLQSVSEMGKPGQEELGRQTAQLLNFQDIQKEIFPVQVAFNLIPASGIMLDSGYSSDEMDLIKSVQKILDTNMLPIQATIITAPVFYGHSEVISIRTLEPMGADKAGELLDNAPGLEIIKNTLTGRPTVVTDASGKDQIMIGRLRSDAVEGGHELSLWCVADNIRSGVALNSVQTAEILVKDYL